MDMGSSLDNRGSSPSMEDETVEAGEKTLSTQFSVQKKAPSKKTGVQKKAPSKKIGVKQKSQKRRSWVWKHYNIVEDKATGSKEGFYELFKEYQQAAGICVPSGAEKLRSESQTQSHYARLEEFELYDPCDCSKSELDKYLDESRKPSIEGFCVLSYWKENSTSFPILASMARDILAIPITSVASESTFSMGGRILNKCRSSLTDENVDALVTTNNWLTGYDDFSQEAISLKVPLDDSCVKGKQREVQNAVGARK